MPPRPADRSSKTSESVTTAQVERLLLDDERAAKTLTKSERDFYEAAERSVVHARRKAETHEGLLQLH